MAILPADESIGRVIVQYPLSEPRVVELLKGSNRNENFVIQDANNHKYVLRRYRRNADEARVLFQLKLQQCLLKKDFPTPEILKTFSGALFVPVDGTPWAVFTFVEGNEYDFSRVEQAGEAGRRLAQFHKILLSFREEPVYLDFNLPQREVLLKSASNLSELEAMFSGQDLDEQLSRCRWQWEKIANDLPITLLDRLPSGWIHRDYHGRNMIFRGDQVRGLFDFDVVTQGPFAYDIAYGLRAFGRESRGSKKIRQEFARQFLDGYSRIRPVTYEEIQAIPSLLFLRGLPEASYYSYRKRDGDNLRDMLVGDVGTFPEMEAESNQLRAILAKHK